MSQVRPGALTEAKDIARTIGQAVIRRGGVVRGFTNWGTFALPQRTTKHQIRQTMGQHFIVRFDSSSEVQEYIRSTLRLDPRMIRFGVVKLGSRLDQIKDVAGKVPWNDNIDTTNAFFDDEPGNKRTGY
ncbi:hypothetical protein KEM55_002242 [Ascosphaera atra]|nr:hypothetical protein KEM55_002242 [Ascosphaera atra]